MPLFANLYPWLKTRSILKREDVFWKYNAIPQSISLLSSLVKNLKIKVFSHLPLRRLLQSLIEGHNRSQRSTNWHWLHQRGVFWFRFRGKVRSLRQFTLSAGRLVDYPSAHHDTGWKHYYSKGAISILYRQRKNHVISMVEKTMDDFRPLRIRMNMTKSRWLYKMNIQSPIKRSCRIKSPSKHQGKVLGTEDYDENVTGTTAKEKLIHPTQGKCYLLSLHNVVEHYIAYTIFTFCANETSTIIIASPQCFSAFLFQALL